MVVLGRYRPELASLRAHSGRGVGSFGPAHSVSWAGTGNVVGLVAQRGELAERRYPFYYGVDYWRLCLRQPDDVYSLRWIDLLVARGWPWVICRIGGPLWAVV